MTYSIIKEEILLQKSPEVTKLMTSKIKMLE